MLAQTTFAEDATNKRFNLSRETTNNPQDVYIRMYGQRRVRKTAVNNGQKDVAMLDGEQIYCVFERGKLRMPYACKRVNYPHYVSAQLRRNLTGKNGQWTSHNAGRAMQSGARNEGALCVLLCLLARCPWPWRTAVLIAFFVGVVYIFMQ